MNKKEGIIQEDIKELDVSDYMSLGACLVAGIVAITSIIRFDE